VFDTKGKIVMLNPGRLNLKSRAHFLVRQIQIVS